MFPVYAAAQWLEYRVSHSGSAAKWLQYLSFSTPQSVLAPLGLNPYKPAISHAWVGLRKVFFRPRPVSLRG
jgi:hypothetical protein